MTVRSFVVVQGDDGQLAVFLVLMLGADRLMGAAITKAELPPADVATCQGDGAQRCTTRALSTLALHHQQLAVCHFGGAVELLGESGDEVEVGFAKLVRLTPSQLPLRVVLPLPRMSLAFPRITSVSGGPDNSTSSTV